MTNQKNIYIKPVTQSKLNDIKIMANKINLKLSDSKIITLLINAFYDSFEDIDDLYTCLENFRDNKPSALSTKSKKHFLSYYSNTTDFINRILYIWDNTNLSCQFLDDQFEAYLNNDPEGFNIAISYINCTLRGKCKLIINNNIYSAKDELMFDHVRFNCLYLDGKEVALTEKEVELLNKGVFEVEPVL